MLQCSWKKHTLYCTLNQLGHVDFVLIISHYKNQVLQIVNLQLSFCKALNVIWKNLSWVNFKNMSFFNFCEMLKHVHNFNIIFYQMNVGKIQLFIVHIFDKYETNIMMKINPELLCDVETF